MNRRTVLRLAGSVPALALAGCAERLQSMGLSTPVLVNIENETELNRNVVIVAYDLEDGRQTYNEAVVAPPEHTTNLGRLTNTDQVVRVALLEGMGEEGREIDAGGRSADDESGAAGDYADEFDESDDDVADVAETLVGEATQSVTVHITEDGLELTVEARDRTRS